VRDLRIPLDRATTAVVAMTARRALRSAVPWGVLFGVLAANEALTYDSTFPTSASRREFADSIGSNPSLSAVIGPGRQLDTLGGVVAWRVFGLMIIAGAIWGLLTATRLLRGERTAVDGSSCSPGGPLDVTPPGRHWPGWRPAGWRCGR
jgi:ABC-2 type transport system permease protein